MKEDDYNRLTGILLEMNPDLSNLGKGVFDETERRLKILTLSIVCSTRLTTSYAHQACLLTVVNCGKRSFQGGVFVELAEDCLCILPGYEGKTISQVVKDQGGDLDTRESTRTLFLGASDSPKRGNHLVFSNWSGGFIKQPDASWDKDVAFPLGAIGSAAIAVSSSFLAAMNIEPLADLKASGISFWNPARVDWHSVDDSEPIPKFFPKNLWLLGLGHLGQAYAWSIGLLPFKKDSKGRFLLQDFDSIKIGNFEAGMLSERTLVNVKKARIVAEYLERAGHQTTIVERKYTEHFGRLDDDPELMLSGLDNAATRRQLRHKDFKGVLDFGLGGNLGTFDLIRFHNLPLSGTPAEVWPEANDDNFKMDALQQLTAKLNDCGFVKGIAVSFVGTFASCLAISELLRAYHEGNKVIKANISLRQLANRNVEIGDAYTFELYSGQIEFSCG
jgi:hypothetical protein